MANPLASRLLACPFCGGPVGVPFENLTDNDDDETVTVWTIRHACPVIKNPIWCEGDGANECAAAWNTRAQVEAPDGRGK